MHLLRCLSMGLLKHDFLDIYLTTVFGALNFGNTAVIMLILFGKYLKFNIDFRNEKKKVRKGFFVFEIIASVLVALNCLY